MTDEIDETTVTVTTDATMTAMMTETEVTTWVVDVIRSVRTKASMTEIEEVEHRIATLAAPRETMTAEAMDTSSKLTGEMTVVMIDEVTMDVDPQTSTLREIASLTSDRGLKVTEEIADGTKNPRMALVVTLREEASDQGLSKVATVATVEAVGEEEVVETSGVVEVGVEIEEVALRAAVVDVVVDPNPSRTRTRFK